MVIHNELKKLRDTKKQMLKKRKILKKEEKNFILISDINNSLSNINTQIYDKCKIIEKYSTFNVKDISEILASLINIYEDEDFLVKVLSYQISGTLFNDTLLIINKEGYDHLLTKKYIQAKEINILIKNGGAIKLLDGFSKTDFPTHISFYEADFMGRVCQNINLRKFAYIKSFIEYIINYRFENNLDQLSINELEILRNKFIYYNLEKIKNHYKVLDENKKAEFEKSLQQKRKIRTKKLQKILNKQK